MMRLLPDLTELDRPLTRFLHANAHSFTRAELLERWSRHALESGLRAGTVIRLLPDVYSAATHRSTPAVRGEALNLWAPRALVTGSLALHLRDPRLPEPPLADLVSAKGDTLHPPSWIRVHQTGVPPTSSHFGGVRCVTAPRALLDAWRYAAPHERSGIVWEALWARTCTWREARSELAHVPRVAGRRELEKLLAWFEDGATSPLEVRARREVFHGTPFGEFEWQAPLRLGTRSVRVDMLHRSARLVVELDGDRYHATRSARDADRARQNDLIAAGYAVLRFGWRDIVGAPQWCRDQVAGLLRARAPRAPQ